MLRDRKQPYSPEYRGNWGMANGTGTLGVIPTVSIFRFTPRTILDTRYGPAASNWSSVEPRIPLIRARNLPIPHLTARTATDGVVLL